MRRVLFPYSCGFVLLTIGLLVAPFAQAKTCLPDRTICVGDYAFAAFAPGSPLVFGKVEELPKDGDGSIQVAGSYYPTNSIARISKNSCAKDVTGHPLCPGSPIKKDGKSGVVLAMFPSGYAVAALQDRKPFASPSNVFIRFEPECDDVPELRDIVKHFDFIKNAIQLPVDNSCPISHEGKPRYPELFSKTGSGHVDCNEVPGSPRADDSPNHDYFANLLKRGMNAPIEDFLKTWYPNRPVIGKGDGDDYIIRCQEKPWMGLRTKNDSIPEECAPDVLYSWGSKAKVDTIEKTLVDSRKWIGAVNPNGEIGKGTVYATPSAVSTFMYGQIPVRIKLKPKTQFRIAGVADIYGAVGYRNDTYQDFLISDASVIESWSYGTPEHYDEIIRDIQRFSSGMPGIRYVRGEPSGKGIDRIFSSGNIDGKINNEQVLKGALLEMIRTILAGEGRIFYSKNTCRNRTEHFLSDKPTYMNP
jgi:hypothetical protein